MLVCPNCRAENVEDAAVCRHCGNSLEAIGSPMRRLDRSEDEPPVELPPPRAQSVWPVVITALVVGIGLLGWGLYAAVRPNPCEGKYSSALFSYCTEIPTGWAGGSRFDPEGNLDRYEHLGTGTATEPGGAETTVEVTEVFDPNVGTQQYVQQFRTSQEADGLNVGPIEGVMLDGEQALAWDFSVEQGAGDGSLEVRDVIVVRGDGAWQIRFVSTEEVYEEARIGFEQMLASWRWKE